MPYSFKRHCNYCGKFYQSSSPHFCSRHCYHKSQIGKRRFIQYNIRICIICKNRYEPTNSTGKRCKQCSIEYIETDRRKYKIEYFKQWRKSHPDYNKTIYWKHPTKKRIQSLNRIHLKRANGRGERITTEQWEELKKQTNFMCRICGKKEPKIKLVMDHVISLSKGGEHKISNIQPLCRACNGRKG